MVIITKIEEENAFYRPYSVLKLFTGFANAAFIA